MISPRADLIMASSAGLKQNATSAAGIRVCRMTENSSGNANPYERKGKKSVNKREKEEIIRFVLISAALILIAVIILLVMPAKALAYDGEQIRTARQDALHEAADILREYGYSDDSEPIKALQQAWRQEQENLDIIAKVIQNEADPQWCEWEHSVAVGVVVLNRVASPFFPNTVKDVVNAPGQYLPAYTRNFSKTSRRAYEAAKAAIDGDHEIPSDCFWQDNKKQGVSVWKQFDLDTGWFRSTTYICRGIPGWQ